ncbi:MAG: DNA internalization-related competence protein ComEC/Rec2 [Clostridiaceae bacterium]|nr:DNA internalization-related competence protein ComEC/Rec2 [Clostridiaceae bacterium]
MLWKRSLSFLFEAERWGLKYLVFFACGFIYLATRMFWTFILLYCFYISIFLFCFEILKKLDRIFFAVLIFFLISISVRASFMQSNALAIKNNIDQKLYLDLEKISELVKAQNNNVLALFQTPKKQNIAIWLSEDQANFKKISGRFFLKLPEKQRNPGGFNEASFLAQYNCYAKIDITSEENLIEAITLNQINNKFSKDMVYREFNDFLEEITNPNVSRFLLSFGFGQKQFLLESTKRDFNNLGLQHILAVSGFHFELFLLPIIELLQLKTKRPLKKLWLTLPFILIFLWLTNYPIGLIRASLVYLLDLIFIKINWIVPKKNLLLIVAIIFILINPLRIFQISFQLSFIAAYIIYDMLPHLNQIKLLNKLPWLKGIVLSILIQIFLAPLLLFHFNQWQISNVFLNSLVYYPLLIAFLGSYLSFFIYFVFMYLPNPFLLDMVKFLGWLLDCFLTFINLISNSKLTTFFSMNGDSIFISLLFILGAIYISRFILYFCRHLRGEKITNSLIPQNWLVLVLGVFIVLNIWNFNQRNWQIYFLDVGQGDSCLIVSPNKRTILVDAGNINKGYQVIMPAMNELGVKKIDYAIISHFDLDHIGGFFDLLNHRLINSIYMPITSLTENTDTNSNANTLKTEFLLACQNQNLKLNFLQKDEFIEFKEMSIKTKILSPIPEYVYQKNSNRESLCFILEIEQLKILFSGDIDEKVEHDLLIQDSSKQELSEKSSIKADILKVSHHGSKTATTSAFLQRVDPDYAIISVGFNWYGHPHPNVIAELEKENINLKRTDKNGAIMLIYKNHKWQLKPYLD